MTTAEERKRKREFVKASNPDHSILFIELKPNGEFITREGLKLINLNQDRARIAVLFPRDKVDT